MVIEVDRELRIWEEVATVGVAGAHGCAVNGLRPEMAECAGVPCNVPWLPDYGPSKTLDYEGAYRDAVVDSKNYFARLFDAKPLNDDFTMPKLDFAVDYEPEETVIVAPFGLSRMVEIPNADVWRPLIKHLRNYDLQVQFMGDPGVRMEGAALTENDQLSDLPLREKIRKLKAARLVVGVVNAWTWIATSGRAAIFLFYPEDSKPFTWFPFADQRYARLLFDRNNLQLPTLLVGLRTVATMIEV